MDEENLPPDEDGVVEDGDDLDQIVAQILATADEVEALGDLWAEALQNLGAHCAAGMRRKAYALNMQLKPLSAEGLLPV